MQDLRETTHSRHYENFRCEKLREMMGGLKEAENENELQPNKNKQEQKFQKEKKICNSRMRPKYLESLLGGHKMRNIMNSFNFK